MTRMNPAYKPLFLILYLIISNTVSAQKNISLKTPDLTKLPKGIQYEGAVKKAVRWDDKDGDHIVILSETGIYVNNKFKHENEGGDAELFAYHFIVQHDSAVQAWRIYDFIADCPVDIEASFIENSFKVTDLNNDGISEIWVMYKTVCHGDVSPSEMKIIMYQGEQKFAIRGQTKVFDGTDEKGKKHYSGGDYKIDKAFAEGPSAFLAFAKSMWKKNIMQ